MEKYIGNKTSILPLIGRFVSDRVPAASSISDLFAGTTNVSRFFRARGFDIVSGDVNRFSYVLGRAYLTHATCPSFEGCAGTPDDTAIERIKFDFHRALRRTGDLFLAQGRVTDIWRQLRPLADALAILQKLGERNRRSGIIVDHFTIWGKKSKFRSVRGTVGQRNYFTYENALFLDGVLRKLHEWRISGRLNADEVFLMLASVIEEVVITANVNGTFHDFNRDRLWPNANQRFFLRLPLVSLSESKAEVLMGNALEAARSVTSHDVCYIDPPYNFRQYSAYYHFLNFIAAFPFLSKPKDYVSRLAFVRGQNMIDDFTSPFCFRTGFIESLRCTITNMDAQHVVLSYYGGRNHWNHWSKVDMPTDQGLRELSALFRDKTLFDECEIVPALSIRQNYQSRVGEQKELVNEYLLFGSRNKRRRRSRKSVAPFGPNVAIGVAEHFSHTVSGGEKPVADGPYLNIRGHAVGRENKFRIG